MNKLLLSVIIQLTFSGILQSQSLEPIIRGTARLFETSQSDLRFPMANDSLMLEQITWTDSTYIDHQIAYNQLRAEDLKLDLGLAINVRGLYNLRGDFEEDINNYTKSRLRTELEWNIIESGLIENRISAKKLQNTNELLALERHEKQRVEWRRQFRIDYTYSINKELIALMQDKELFLGGYFDLLTQLYQQKYILREELLQTGQQLSKVGQEIELLRKINHRLEDSVSLNTSNVSLPIVAIDTLPEGALTQRALDSLLFAGAKFTHHWTNDLEVSLFTNYNWVQTELNNRDFAAVGLRVSVPLRTNRRKELIQTKVEMEKAYYLDQETGNKNQLVTYLDAYREKAGDLRTQYQNWLILEERKRREQLLKDEYGNLDSGLKLLEIQSIQFDILENTLKLKKQLYTAISHLYQLEGSLRLIPFPFEAQKEERISVGTMDSNFDQARLIQFAQAQQIQTIYWSNTEGIDPQTWEAAGIKMALMDPEQQYRPIETWMASVANILNPKP